MSIWAKFARLSAAVLAVAGVFGTVMAAPPVIITGLDNQADEASGAVSGSLKASFEVENVAILEVESKNATNADLILANIATAPNANPGNLGAIRVKTTSAAWDIQMTTEHGGRLYKPGMDDPNGGFDSSCTGTPNWLTNACPDAGGWTVTPKKLPGVYLLYAPGSTPNATDNAFIAGPGGAGNRDTVRLRVAIGLAESVLGEDTSVNGPFGTLTTYAAPGAGTTTAYQIANADLDATGTITTGTASADQGPVSFAHVLGTGGEAAIAVPPAAATGGVTLAGTNGFGPVPNWTYFYFNAGLREADYNIIGGNKAGTYQETFTFKLMTNF